MYIQKDYEERNFMLLKKRIYDDTSLNCDQYKPNYLKRRIKVRMFARSLNTYREYLNLLRSDPLEYDDLLKDITINVTMFFRDPEVFKILEEELIPLLIYQKVKRQRNTIRIWSAGCASGEEAYSLAIVLKELLGDEFNNFNVSIYGTDIDKNSLKNAAEANYLPRQIEFVKPVYLKRYFKFDGNMYELSDEIKDMVRFKNLDLFADRMGTHFDIILCRNVLIYFNKEVQNDLFSKFYNALNSGGYLVIGKTETIFGDADKRFTTINAKERIYQK